MTNEEIAEQLVRNHKDFKAEGFSEYMNGYLNGIILGLEYAQGNVKNLSSNTVLGYSLPIKSNCPDCGNEVDNVIHFCPKR